MAFSIAQSEALWKRRHTYRQARLRLWRALRSRRYKAWQKARDQMPEGDPLRSKTWAAYEEADKAVDKWLGLRDEASGQLKRRRKQLAARGEQASEHFRISEFDTHDGTEVPKVAHDGVRSLCRSILEPMRDEFGPCRVTSGYRHRAYNAGIGGATSSYHIYDLRPYQPAADVSFARGNPAQWAAFARRLGKGGVGQYNRSGFVHVDLGPRRDWSG